MYFLYSIRIINLNYSLFFRKSFYHESKVEKEAYEEAQEEKEEKRRKVPKGKVSRER